MRLLFISAVLFLALAGCGEKQDSVKRDEPPPPSGPNLTQTPDVGKVEQVSVTAKGTGMTPGAAVNDALKTAIMQVNGTTVDASSANLNTYAKVTATLDVETAEGVDSAKATATMQGQAFAESIVTNSKGVVSSFKVVKITPPQSKGQGYAVDIEASIAKFKAPADAGKVKIVIAPLRSNKQSFNIGGKEVPASQVLAAVRQQIVDALSQTGRFSVLDREFEGEILNELNLISSGQTPNTDFAKLSQALSADLIWIGVVNDLAYNKHVRRLQTSDRELVSYSGNWSLSQRLINVATRQIFQSGTLEGAPPPIAPTTMQVAFDESAALKTMQTDMIKQSVEAILLRTFPISVVELDGENVVLSQGGQALKENSRYKIYLQGKEIKDPQTGQSLGNMESQCCEVVVNRVTPNLSYGTLENVKVKLDGVKPGALQIREMVVAPKMAQAAPAVAAAEDAEESAKPQPVAVKAPARERSAAKPAAPKSEDW